MGHRVHRGVSRGTQRRLSGRSLAQLLLGRGALSVEEGPCNLRKLARRRDPSGGTEHGTNDLTTSLSHPLVQVCQVAGGLGVPCRRPVGSWRRG